MQVYLDPRLQFAELDSHLNNTKEWMALVIIQSITIDRVNPLHLHNPSHNGLNSSIGILLSAKNKWSFQHLTSPSSFAGLSWSVLSSATLLSTVSETMGSWRLSIMACPRGRSKTSSNRYEVTAEATRICSRTVIIQTRQFFSLPQEAKSRIVNVPGPHPQRGWSWAGSEQTSRLWEGNLNGELGKDERASSDLHLGN